MGDPLRTQWDLLFGNPTPYTDNSDPAAPPVGILGPIMPSASPQDQSAAQLDPSAFAPSADLNVLAPPTPPGAAILKTADDFPFYAPAGTDFNEVYQAGQKIRGKSLSDQLDAIGRDLGHGGTYDFQRQGGTFNKNYQNASNFAVGAYMNGAGYSWPETEAISSLYAIGHGRPDIIPGDKPWWQAGYEAAKSGKLP